MSARHGLPGLPVGDWDYLSIGLVGYVGVEFVGRAQDHQFHILVDVVVLTIAKKL